MLTARYILFLAAAIGFVSCQKETADPANSNPPTPAAPTPVYVHQDPNPDIDISSTDSLTLWTSYYVPTENGPYRDSVDLDMDGDVDVVFNALNYYSFESNVTPANNYQRRVDIYSMNASVEFCGSGVGPWVKYMAAGDTIGAALSPWVGVSDLSFVDHGLGFYAGFSGTTFVAFRFVDGNGQFRYGWMQFTDYGIVSGYKHYLLDWAWNNTANMEIPAGDY